MTKLWMIACAAISLPLAGCASLRSTDQVAVDYNKSFANARNKVLLLNILRAGVHEPLQFSTMSSVSGTVGNSGSIEIPFAGLIGPGKLGIAPTLSINDGLNPTVTIIPLGQKEFTQGLLRPVSAETVDLFLGQGWDRELILPLVVGGVACSEAAVHIDTGDPAWAQYITDSAKSARSFTLAETKGEVLKTVSLPAADALSLVKEGLGPRYDVSLAKAKAKQGKPSANIEVEIREASRTTFSNLDVTQVCRSKFNIPGSARPEVVLRSPAAIIAFLGRLRQRLEAQAYDPSLPRLNRTSVGSIDVREFVTILPCDRVEPVDAAVSTIFRGTRYCVPRSATRTLQILSFLDDIIALQTSESTVRASSPVIAITPR